MFSLSLTLSLLALNHKSLPPQTLVSDLPSAGPVFRCSRFLLRSGGGGAKYRDQRVCNFVCLSVCLSLSARMSEKNTYPNFTKFM